LPAIAAATALREISGRVDAVGRTAALEGAALAKAPAVPAIGVLMTRLLGIAGSEE
jgi:hypothetical protein